MAQQTALQPRAAKHRRRRRQQNWEEQNYTALKRPTALSRCCLHRESNPGRASSLTCHRHSSLGQRQQRQRQGFSVPNLRWASGHGPGRRWCCRTAHQTCHATTLRAWWAAPRTHSECWRKPPKLALAPPGPEPASLPPSCSVAFGEELLYPDFTIPEPGFVSEVSSGARRAWTCQPCRPPPLLLPADGLASGGTQRGSCGCASSVHPPPLTPPSRTAAAIVRDAPP